MARPKGIEIKTTDNAYKPAEDTALAIKSIESIIASLKAPIMVLDMGTGSGILGIRVAISAAVKHVTFADINPDALSLARYNVGLNKGRIRAACSFVQSDLFSSIDGRFDLIIFNAPYLMHEEKDKDMLSKAWDGGPGGVEVSIDFLRQARLHLNEGGRVVLIASSQSELQKLLTSMDKFGYKIDRRTEEHIFFEDIIAFELRISK